MKLQGGRNSKSSRQSVEFGGKKRNDMSSRKITDFLHSKKSYNPKKTTPKSYKRTYLPLNMAISSSKAMNDWSPARINAFKNLNSNPNAYYYRFNAPNEEQKTGEWTEEEKALFYKRAEEVGVNGNWGIFSMAIPGRVGYQCSNFYRKLIIAGEVVDPQYFFDESGVLRYKRNPDDHSSVVKRPRKDVDNARQLPHANSPSKKQRKPKPESPKEPKRPRKPKYVTMEIEIQGENSPTRSGRTPKMSPKTQLIRVTMEEYEAEMARRAEAKVLEMQAVEEAKELRRRDKEAREKEREKSSAWDWSTLNTVSDSFECCEGDGDGEGELREFEERRRKQIEENANLLKELGIESLLL